MDTNNQQDNGQVTWEQLFTDEQRALQNINGHIDPVIWKRLVNRGLVSTELATGEGYVTPLGRSVLSQADNKPATITAKPSAYKWAWQPFGPDESIYSFTLAGSHYRGFPVIKIADDEKAEIESGKRFMFIYKGIEYVVKDGKVMTLETEQDDASYEKFIKDLKASVEDETHTVITAKQFINEGYAAKQAKGNCIVWRSKEKIEQIIAMWRSKIDGTPVEVIKPKDGHIFESSTIDGIVYVVEWLPQPAQDAPTNEDKYPEATKFGQDLAAKHMGMVEDAVKAWAKEQDATAVDVGSDMGDTLANTLYLAISDLGRNNYQEIENKCNEAFNAYRDYVANLRQRAEAAEGEVARLKEALKQAQSTFVTIQAYPDAESEMDCYSQIRGMIQQAEFGAEQAHKAASTGEKMNKE